MENDQSAQSEADTSRVTKAQVFRFLELQFSLADIDKDSPRHKRQANFSESRHLGGFTEE
jgi:hypothetical protein